MKLPIKKKFFDQIKSGEKELEWRDAHITFICEETGEKLRRDITGAIVTEKESYERWDIPNMSEEDFKKMFTDKYVIGFRLHNPEVKRRASSSKEVGIRPTIL